MKLVLLSFAGLFAAYALTWLQPGDNAQSPGIVLPPRASELEGVAASIAPKSERTERTANATAYRLRLEFDASEAAIEGQVPDEVTRDALLQVLQEKVGTDRVLSDITVEPALGAQLAEVIQIMVGQANQLAAAKLVLTQMQITLDGRAHSAIQRDAIVAGVRAATPFGVALDLDIDLPTTDASPACQRRFSELMESAPLTFHTGNATLQRSSAATLDRLVVAAANCATTQIELATLSNALARARARTVKQYLVMRGVAAERLEITSERASSNAGSASQEITVLVGR